MWFKWSLQIGIMAQVQVFIVGIWKEEAGMLLEEWKKRKPVKASEHTVLFISSW